MFLTAAASLAAASSVRAASRPRLAAIDWAMLETATAIGHMPVAACELLKFRTSAGEPAIPETVVDLGLRGSPNFELLQLTRPDFILTSPYYVQYQRRLEAIAPVVNMTFYVPGEAPLPKALAAVTDLSAAIGDPNSAARALDRFDTGMASAKAGLAAFSDRPFCVVNLGDARHLRAFGSDSMFGSVLDRLGLTNSWIGGTRFRFLAPVPIERLIEFPDANLVVVGEVPPQARHGLSRSVLWKALPQVADRRTYHLPEVNAFGGLPAALRFARLLAHALNSGPTELA